MTEISDIVHALSQDGGISTMRLRQVNGRRMFSEAFGIGTTTDVFYYYILSQTQPEWEWGTGHISSNISGEDVLVRDTVISSSNAGTWVHFTAGPKDVVNDLPSNLQGVAPGSITRSQISSLILPPGLVTLGGYNTLGDLGQGAVYSSIGASANSPGAIQDRHGTWFGLSLNNEMNLGWFGVNNDGVTDNSTQFSNFRKFVQTFRTGFKKNTCTISITNPAVVTLAFHGFQWGTPVQFSTTGSLPTGLSVGVTYYVMLTGLTLNTFQISLHNPAATNNGDGAPVITTGTQSGTQSVTPMATEWADVVLPPGQYFSSSGYDDPISETFLKKARFHGYGVISDSLNFAENALSDLAFTTGTHMTAYFNTVEDYNQSTIQLVNPADSSKFFYNQWVLLMALDLQGVDSTPPNNHYNEYHQIDDINPATGVITFKDRIRNAYKSTYPIYYAGFPSSSPSASPSAMPRGGAALIVSLCQEWDKEQEISGVRLTKTGETLVSARYTKLTDVYADGQGAIPTVCQTYIAENCRFNQLEVDKLIETLEFHLCHCPQIFIQSSSVDRVIVDGSNIEFMNGTGRITHVHNCTFGLFQVGVLFYGASEILQINSSRITTLTEASRIDAPKQAGAINNLVEFGTFSNGTLSYPLTIGPQPWAVPGRKMYVSDGNGTYRSMGAPFAILDVRTDGVNTLIDTTLTSKPVGSSTNSVVTITIASPGVINWAAHGLIADTPVTFLTTGALPTGITAGTIYYVSASGLGAGSFEISATAGGSAINLSGSQSGTHTGVSNPLQYIPVAMPRVTIRNCTGSAWIAAQSSAPPELPLYSYDKRFYAGNAATPGGLGILGVNQLLLRGNLVSMTVNVIRAYTGGSHATLTATISADAFNSSLIANNMSQVIDLKTVGVRTITPSGTTGSAGIDVIAAFGDWIAAEVDVVFSGDISGDTLDQSPLFEVEVLTDQGEIAQKSIQTWSQPINRVFTLADTNVPGFA